MKLSDYYLVKSFEQELFRDEFNTGKKLYCKNTSYFWQIENTFQQDLEGKVFQHIGNGYLIAANEEFEEVVKSAKSIDDIMNGLPGKGEVLATTSDFNIWINGYLCCFYLLPKADIYRITEDGLEFANINAEQDMLLYLKKYTENVDNGEIYISIYDAELLCKSFGEQICSRGYKIAFGKVDYSDISYLDRLHYFQCRDFERIVFTKPTDFRYQKEFRIFLTNDRDYENDHIEETGIDISQSLVLNFAPEGIIKSTR